MTDQQPWPAAPPPPPGDRYGYQEEFLPELEVAGPHVQRRWTVLLRLILVIPQVIVLFFLSIAVFFVAIVGWFGALFTGRLPDGIDSFLARYVAYETRVNGYEMLLVDQYPPFAFSGAPGYPIQIDVRPGTLNRMAVLFRIFLMIPAAIVQGIVMAGWHTLGILIWLVTLILGRMPNFVFGASAAALRFSMRFTAYALMLTPAYPKKLFGDGPLPAGESTRGTRPLLLDGAAKALLVVFLIVGLFSDGYWNWWRADNNNDSLRAPASVTDSR